MALQQSGPIKISEINVELGLGPSDLVELTGNVVPEGTSLFGRAGAGINTNAPHKISEFYGFQNMDDFSSSQSYFTVTEACAGAGAVYNKKYHDGLGDWPTIGANIFTQSKISAPYNGQNKWYKLQKTPDTIIKIDTLGEVTDYVLCSGLLSLNPSNKDNLTGSAQSFNITISSGYSWTVSESASWLTLNAISGGGDFTLVVTAPVNNTAGPRQANLTFDTAYQQIIFSVTQAVAVETHKSMLMGFGSTSTEACDNYGPMTAVTRYVENSASDFASANQLKMDVYGTSNAPAGWYSRLGDVKYWNGSSFTVSQLCDGGGGL